MRVSYEDLYIKVILLFPVFTLIQSHIGFLNKYLFFFLFAIQLFMIYKKRINKKSFFLILISIILEIWALFNTKLPLYNLNDMFYFPFMVIYFEYFIYHKNNLIKCLINNRCFIKMVVYIWSIMIIVSAVLPGSYAYTSEWGNERYFQSFTNSPFRLCPTALFIMTLVLVIMMIEKNKSFIIWSFIPMFCFFSSGSRIYFGIGILLFLIIWYRYFYDKLKFWLSLLPLIAVMLIVFLNSSIINKFESTMYTQNSYFDFWGTITNSRSVFWEADLKAFSEAPFINRILGNGFNFVYDVNYKAVHSYIWAHNDFIQVLTTYGYLGLTVYCVLLGRLFKYCVNNGIKKEKAIVCLTVMIWFFNAFFNMFYTYFCSALSFPFLVISVRYKQVFDERKNNL